MKELTTPHDGSNVTKEYTLPANSNKEEQDSEQEEQIVFWFVFFLRCVSKSAKLSKLCCTHRGTYRPVNMDLVSKPRSKSTVWLYFGLKADEKGRPLNSEEAICRLCRKIVLAKGGNTTNLRSHLKRRHRADFFETLSSSSSGALFDSQGDLPTVTFNIRLTATFLRLKHSPSIMTPILLFQIG